MVATRRSLTRLQAASEASPSPSLPNSRSSRTRGKASLTDGSVSSSPPDRSSDIEVDCSPAADLPDEVDMQSNEDSPDVPTVAEPRDSIQWDEFSDPENGDIALSATQDDSHPAQRFVLPHSPSHPRQPTRSHLGSPAAMDHMDRLRSASEYSACSTSSGLPDASGSWYNPSATSTAPTSAAPSPAPLPTSPPSVLLPSLLDPAQSVQLTLGDTPAPDGYQSYMPRRARPPRRSQRTRKPSTMPSEDTSDTTQTSTNETSPASDVSRDTATSATFTRRLDRHAKCVKKLEVDSSAAPTPVVSEDEGGDKPEDHDELKSDDDRDNGGEEKDGPDPSGEPAKTRRGKARPPKKPKSKSAGYTPRPPNAWILYRSAQILVLKADEVTSRRPQSDISKLIGYMWRDESPEVKTYYEEQARIKKAEHARLYPDYVFQPNRKGRLDSGDIERTRPGNPRRSTAPASTNRSSPYNSQHRTRSTSNESGMSAFRLPLSTPTSATPSVLDFPSSSVYSPDTPCTPHDSSRTLHADFDYASDFVVNRSVEALLACLNQTALDYSPLAANNDMPMSAPATFECVAGFDQFNTDPYLAGGTNFPPLSAPAAVSGFNFSHVPPVFGNNSTQFGIPEVAAFTPSPMAPSLSTSASSEDETYYSIHRHLNYSAGQLGAYTESSVTDFANSDFATSLASPIIFPSGCSSTMPEIGDLSCSTSQPSSERLYEYQPEQPQPWSLRPQAFELQGGQHQMVVHREQPYLSVQPHVPQQHHQQSHSQASQYPYFESQQQPQHDSYTF